MAASWKSLLAESQFDVTANGGAIVFPDGRRQVISIDEDEQAYIVRSTVMGAHALKTAGVSATRIWELNRSATLVGFRIDKKGRLIGEAKIPKIALTADEFRLIALNLAQECDRLEYLFTGRDRE